MLRRAPTSISLSNRDVKEHFEHFDRRENQDRETVQPKQDHRVPSAQPACELTDLLAKQLKKNAQNEVTVYEYGRLNQQQALQGGAFPFLFPRELAEEDSREESPLSDLDPDRLQLGEVLTIDPCTDSGIEDNVELIDPANSLEHLEDPPVTHHEDSLQDSSQTTRNTFDCGGFVEVNADQSSSFRKFVGEHVGFSLPSKLLTMNRRIVWVTSLSVVPQDTSTPHCSEMPEVNRLRTRYPLPRSPLYQAQGVNSPERRLTTSLSPHVASYGTLGLLLSQPARRPRNYRLRTISYASEESEIASTAYEQVQGSDNDSIGSQFLTKPQRNLHKELEAGSLQSAFVESNVSLSPPDFAETSLSMIARATPAAERNQQAHSSPPQLLLPSPFSVVRRNTFMMASLSSAHGDVRQSRSPISMYDLPQIQASHVTSSTTSSSEEDLGLRSSSMLRNLAALPLRLLSVYHSQSPFQTRFGPVTGRVSPPSQISQSQGPEDAPPTSAHHQFRVYDDSMPASSQPQTPQHLPEAQHQSRYHPLYTAPASIRMESSRPSRSEVETPGLQGLYGGQENIEDDVMFDRASQQLWALSLARWHGRSMSNTPDRELSFADIADSREDIR